MREADWIECYQALRYNGLDIVGSFFYATILWLRKTQIQYQEF